MAGLSSLDPMVASAEKAIEKMPPDKAVEFLLSKGVNPRLAGLVMKNRVLKQAAQKQAQPPQRTVADDIDSGIAQLPVSGQMFNGGAGVAPPAHFDSGGPVTDYMPQLMQAMYQKAAYQPGQGYQKPSYMMSDEEQAAAAAAAAKPQMAGGGIVAFAPGGSAVGPYAQQYAQDPNLRRPAPFDMSSAMDEAAYAPGPNPQRVWALGPELRNAPLKPAGIMPDIMPSAAPQPPAPAPVPTSTVPPTQSLPPRQVPTGDVSNSASASARGPVAAGQIPGGMGPTPEMRKVMEDQKKIAENNRPPTYEGAMQQLTDIAEKYGVGAAAKQHLQELQDRHADLSKLAQQGKWAALAQAGFAMAQAATQNPHGGFLGALAIGGQKGGEEFKKVIDQQRQLAWNIQDQKYAVREAQENLVNDRSKEAVSMVNNANTRYDRMVAQMTDTQLKVLELTQGKQLAYLARMSQEKVAAASRYRANPQAEMWSRYEEARTPEEKRAVLSDIRSFNAASPQATAAENRIYGSSGWQQLEAMATRPPPNDDPSSDEYKRWDARRQSAMQQMEDITRRFGNTGGTGGGTSSIQEAAAAELERRKKLPYGSQ